VNSGGVFSEPAFYLRTCPAHPIRAHTCSAITRRLCGWLGASGTARFESSEALAELPAVARTAVELHGCCARVSLAAALLSQHIDGVTRVGSAGTKSRSRARSLILLTMLAPVVENRTVQGSATARRRSELANRRRGDGSTVVSCRRHRTSVGDLPTSSVSAVQLIPEKACSAPTPP